MIRLSSGYTTCEGESVSTGNINQDKLLVTIEYGVAACLTTESRGRFNSRRHELKAMVLQASWVVDESVHSRLGDQGKEILLWHLEAMVRRYVCNFSATGGMTKEEIWLAVVDTLWNEISEASGVTFTKPTLACAQKD